MASHEKEAFLTRIQLFGQCPVPVFELNILGTQRHPARLTRQINTVLGHPDSEQQQTLAILTCEIESLKQQIEFADQQNEQTLVERKEEIDSLTTSHSKKLQRI